MSRLRRAAWLLALGWTAVLLGGMLTPGTGLPPVFSAHDKLTHAGAFFVFALLWLLALPGPAPRRLRQVALLSVVFAVGTELLQHLLPIGRYGDPVDALADLTGTALAVALLAWWMRRLRRPRPRRSEEEDTRVSA